MNLVLVFGTFRQKFFSHNSQCKINNFHNKMFIKLYARFNGVNFYPTISASSLLNNNKDIWRPFFLAEFWRTEEKDDILLEDNSICGQGWSAAQVSEILVLVLVSCPWIIRFLCAMFCSVSCFFKHFCEILGLQLWLTGSYVTLRRINLRIPVYSTVRKRRKI